MQQIETAEDAMRFVTAVMQPPKETGGMYLEFINRYLEHGAIPEPEEGASSLLRYVIGLMENPFIQIMVFTKPVMASIFRATTMRYVLARLKQITFQRQRSQFAARDIQTAYQYAPNMRGSEWKSLVSKVAEQYEDYGFDKKFMDNLLDNGGALEPQKWNKLIIDWATALQRKMAQEDIDKENSQETRSFRPDEQVFTDIDKDITNYQQNSTISDMEAFEQTIETMHGIWSRSEFERTKSIALRHKRYPSIDLVVNKMGRKSDEDGTRQIPISTGSSLSLDHSSGSDIEGVTTSRQLKSLLPTELAFYADEHLSDVFWYKYMQGSLQSFRYQSHLAKPTHKLKRTITAKPKGPMIVCIDTSSSMNGEPMRIAQSLLSRVVWMANRQHRRCYLIYYSEHICTIDLQLSNWDINELKTVMQGGTDATEMLTEVFHLLSSDENYMCADVLWVSDFLVPDVKPSLLSRLNDFRQSDTRFYGYQIGDCDTIWSSRLDKMYHYL